MPKDKTIDQAAIKKILIIKIAAIGDLLLITPALRAIRKNFPQAEITLLVGKWSRPIIEGNPNIDKIIEVPDEVFFKIKPFSLLKLIFSLKQQKFDLTFVWHRALPFRFFAYLLGIKNRVGFSRSGDHTFLNYWVEENPSIHEIYEYQSTLKPIGIESHEMDMDLLVTEADHQFADRFWAENNLTSDDRVIGIAPGGAKNPKEDMPLRHWPPEYYAQLSDLLLTGKRIKIVFLGAENDRKVINEVIGHMSQNDYFNLCGKLNLKQLGAVIKQCWLFIGNDSSPIHIAAAVQTPVISFFGPTDPKEKAPLNYKHKYFDAGMACSPCYKNGKYPTCKDKKCMYAIKPQQVYQTIAGR